MTPARAAAEIDGQLQIHMDGASIRHDQSPCW
jgi:hypothetical protein